MRYSKGDFVMFGINEILGKVFFKKSLTEEEKFIISHFKRINPKVVEYLIQKLNNLYIEVLGDYEGSLFQLMIAKKLEGECWQVTESVIVLYTKALEYKVPVLIKRRNILKKYTFSFVL